MRREGDQPLPVPNDQPGITRLVIADLLDREKQGIASYGTTLQPFNGRRALLDLYQELLDGAQYAKQQLIEDETVRKDLLSFFDTSEELVFRSDMKVDLVHSIAYDGAVVVAARVSTAEDQLAHVGTDPEPGSGEDRLIQFLMRNRHGSPFEHSTMTFFVEAPIFVFRELMRHRNASYNEESGRYKQLRPVFYVPGPERKLQQVGKAGAYTFVAGSPAQSALADLAARRIAQIAYCAYEEQLAAGIAREVARMVLPLSIYSSAYVTMNARGLMNFLSLRIASETAAVPSFPQREIEMVAELMEKQWSKQMPLTHAAFVAQGRVAP